VLERCEEAARYIGNLWQARPRVASGHAGSASAQFTTVDDDETGHAVAVVEPHTLEVEMRDVHWLRFTLGVDRFVLAVDQTVKDALQRQHGGDASAEAKACGLPEWAYCALPQGKDGMFRPCTTAPHSPDFLSFVVRSRVRTTQL
jgi:hypothetical protein